MSVLSVLISALRGGRRHSGSEKEVSLASALTSGLYEVSQAMSAPAEDVQRSLDAQYGEGVVRLAGVLTPLDLG